MFRADARRLTLPAGVLLVALLLPMTAAADLIDGEQLHDRAHAISDRIDSRLAPLQDLVDLEDREEESDEATSQSGNQGSSSNGNSTSNGNGSGSGGSSGSGSGPLGPANEALAAAQAARDEATREAVKVVNEAGLIVELVREELDRAPSTLASAIPKDLLGEKVEPEETDWEPQAQSSEIPLLSPALVLVAGAATAASVVFFWMMGSSGAATAAPAAQSLAGRRVAPIFSPLFTRFEGRKVLEHPNRMQLYTLISGQPGIRLQDLCNETGLSRTAVTHHLRLLETQHLIVSKHVGRSRHFYENGGRFERCEKDAYAVLQNDRSRAVANYIQQHPGSIQKQLCEALGLRASIAHWHVRRLEEASLIDSVRQGRTVNYYPADAMARVTV